MIEQRALIAAYREIYKYWNENCDKLKEMPSGILRSKIFHINMGLSFAMHEIAKIFHHDSHVEFTQMLKEADQL